jgi:hypothetical protein
MRYTFTVAILIHIALAGGCSASWHDVPGAVVTPVASADRSDYWQEAVEDAVANWTLALAEQGCDTPFTVGEGGHPIVLVPEYAWPHEEDSCAKTWDGFGFEGYEERIEVRDGLCASRMTITHELGHALGVDHPGDDTMRVVMNPYPSQQAAALTSWDVMHAAAAIDCH